MKSVVLIFSLLLASCAMPNVIPSGRYKIVIDDDVAYTPSRIECATEYAFVEGGGITWVDCYTKKSVVYFKAANETLSVESFE